MKLSLKLCYAEDKVQFANGEIRESDCMLLPDQPQSRVVGKKLT